MAEMTVAQKRKMIAELKKASKMHIEKRLDEGSAKFKRLEMLIWGVYPFILVSVVLAKIL
jgi:hypothetical protein